MHFMESIHEEMNLTTTENGALTHKTSLSALVDFFSRGAALRTRTEGEIIALFSKAFAEDHELAVKCLFYVRDIRGGQGERRTFRICFKWLLTNFSKEVEPLISLIPEYGRYDDVLSLFYVNPKLISDMILMKLTDDQKRLNAGKPISLLAKWLPSINTSSKTTRTIARDLCKAMDISQAAYRRILSQFRAYLKLVEKNMSANNWESIQYAEVPSRASMLYRKAFARHDEARYAQYLADVKSGKTAIHAGTLYPYDIVKRYLEPASGWDETLEEQWKALPNYMDVAENSIVVADVSGSMQGVPLAVSISLALYFAERNTGAFKDYFMTFSLKPKVQHITGKTLFERVQQLECATWGMNTNLYAVFQSILTHARAKNAKPEELPSRVYIISDMEFDSAIEDDTTMQSVQKLYQVYGYEAPEIIFWNVDARNDQSPITVNDKGVCMVSGCSPVILKYLLNKKILDAKETMLTVLSSERYQPITLA